MVGILAPLKNTEHLCLSRSDIYCCLDILASPSAFETHPAPLLPSNHSIPIMTKEAVEGAEINFHLESLLLCVYLHA
jgi:hypothetical protein